MKKYATLIEYFKRQKMLIFAFFTLLLKVKSRVYKGIPDSWRGKVWPLLANLELIKIKHKEISY